MGGSTDKVSQLVAATANRLRMVQVDFSDQSAESRREYLSEEIERALANVVPEDRQRFLTELMAQFPSWDTRVEVALRKDESTDRTRTDEKELQDPNFLVARLINRAATLSEGERRVLTERLREAGLVAVSAGGLPEGAAAALRQNLRLAAEKDIDPTRALELVAMLADFACRLDQLVWNAWRKISPRSEIRRGESLQSNVRECISGSPDVPRGNVAGDLERLRQLIASVVSAVGQSGRQFASRHLARFSPVEIEALASMEGGGFLVSKEVKCWRKYTELADALNEAAIENEIMDTIATYAESLMRGLSR